MRERAESVPAPGIRQQLDREAFGRGLEPQGAVRVAGDDHARSRAAVRAAEPERLDEIHHPIGLAALRHDREHEIRPHVT